MKFNRFEGLKKTARRVLEANPSSGCKPSKRLLKYLTAEAS